MSARPPCPLGRRGRPGRPPDPEKRESILAAARDLFLADGYGASMDRIAERAGVSKQTIYTHFAGKEDLFQSIVRAHCDRILEPLDGPAGGPAGGPASERRAPRAVLTALGTRLMELMALPDYGQLLRTLSATAAHAPDAGRDYFAAGPQRSHAALTTYLAAMDRGGVLKVPDPVLAAEQFFGLVNGHTQLRALLGVGGSYDEAERRRRVEAAVAMFLAAYAPPASSGP